MPPTKIQSTPDSKFWLPPKGSLEPNHLTDDPLRYYYYPFIGKLYQDRITQTLSLLSPPYDRALEIGYGSGLLFPTLSKISMSFAGVDLKKPPANLKLNLSQIGLKTLPDLFTGDILSCAFQKEEFDLVISISVFEHIKDPSEMLDEISRILSPNGSLLIGMPRVDKTMDLLFKFIGFPNIDDHHVTTHSQFLKFAEKRFILTQIKKFNPLTFSVFPLYYSMLFKKRAS